MKILIQQVTILSSASEHHGKVKDVIIADDKIGKIAEPGSIQEKADRTINGKGLYISPGWFDLHVNFREPGFEYKEDLESGCKAAIQGGFTGVLCMPDTFPPVHSKSIVEFIKNRTKDQLVDVYPAGTLSHNLEGKDLSEMFDMYRAGAFAFTDNKHAVQDSGLMIRALLYAKNFGGKIFSFAEDFQIAQRGQMNEGITSTSLGLKGIPALAEEVMVNRDLSLAEYTDAPVHFSTISTSGSVALIREAKKKGQKITADVSAAHLYFDDSVLKDFDTNFKTKPSLRTNEDITALIEGLKDGTIDAICSDHTPEDVENKRKEFDLAEFGMSGLETAFAAINTAMLGKLPLEVIIEKISSGPRRILGIPVITIQQNAPANLTLFDASMKWNVNANDLHSKSANNPFLGLNLTGKPLFVFNKGKMAECK